MILIEYFSNHSHFFPPQNGNLVHICIGYKLTHCKFTNWLFTSIQKCVVLCMLSSYPSCNINLILKFCVGLKYIFLILRPTLANAFLCCYLKKWLEQCPDKFKPVYYRRYVDDIFVLFKSRDHLIKFRDYLKKCHYNMKFSFEEEKNGKLSLLDVEVSREGNKFATTVYRKPTFWGVYTHFDSFYLLHRNLAWFIPWFSDVFQYVPTGLTFIMS